MVVRKIVHIDEEKCNGCGLCIPECVEGALKIIDGKARLISEKYCDGLGACLGHCPNNAISIEEREAEKFDEAAVEKHLHFQHSQAKYLSCPGSQVMVQDEEKQKIEKRAENKAQINLRSRLSHWPIQLSLVPVNAPYFQGADLLVTADCVPFAYSNFHEEYLKGKVLVIGCPKLDDILFYQEKLKEIFSLNKIKSVKVLHMEVPCCYGLVRAVEQAIADSGKKIPFTEEVVKVFPDNS